MLSRYNTHNFYYGRWSELIGEISYLHKRVGVNKIIINKSNDGFFWL
jgi:hypothetical protein